MQKRQISSTKIPLVQVQDGVHMKIKGHFFMWQLDNVNIPFRFFEGELYVAVSHPIVLEKTMEIARSLEANYIEG